MPVSAETLLNRFTTKAKFRHMLVMIKLSELGSMRRAALAVNMTQPAISQLVSELERLLETELFFRHARGVEPTSATRDLLPVARRILEALKDGAETLANHLLEYDGVVRVSATPAALGGIIHGKLDGFVESYPNVQVSIFQIGAADPLTDVTESSADIIFLREPAVIPKGWDFEYCLSDTLTAICGYNHPFADKEEVSIEELGTGKWLMNRVGSVARRRFEAIAEQHDWPKSAACHVIMHIPELTKDMLLTGKYLAIAPRSVALPWLNSGQVVELQTEIDEPLPPLGFLWQKEQAGTATTVLAEYLLSDKTS